MNAVVDRLIERIEKDKKIINDNRLQILKYSQFCFAKGLKEKRIIKYIYSLKLLSKHFGKPFVKCNKNDVIRVMAEIEKTDYSELTKKDYKVCLKVFFRWLRQTEEFPEEVKWIKETAKNNQALPDILTEEEIQKMVSAGSNWRDKIFILGLYESGCRIEEYLNLKIKDVVFDEYSPILIVNGKTGSRRVRIIDKDELLKKWLSEHPFKDDPNAYVWVSLAYNGKNQQLSYSHASKILKNIGKKAEIKKKIYCHLLRHSRATHLAKTLTESQLKQMFGWTMGSDMTNVYIHLSGRDLDEPLLKMFNVIKHKEKQQKLDKIEDIVIEAFKTNPKFKELVLNAVEKKGIK